MVGSCICFSLFMLVFFRNKRAVPFYLHIKTKHRTICITVKRDKKAENSLLFLVSKCNLKEKKNTTTMTKRPIAVFLNFVSIHHLTHTRTSFQTQVIHTFDVSFSFRLLLHPEISYFCFVWLSQLFLMTFLALINAVFEF